jgi:crotonobetainyl-CoA:carnitine CoA-transferase CaiB-like acyl-CoA transferase
VFACADGYVACNAARADVESALKASAEHSPAHLEGLTRADAAALLNAAGVAAAPVQTVPEAIAHAQTGARRLWFAVTEDGDPWPLFASPLRLVRTPPQVSRPGPLLDADGPAILRELGLAREAAAEKKRASESIG